MTSPAVWYVFPALKLGGAELHVVSLAAALRKRGFETAILTIFEEGDLAEMARSRGVPLFCLYEKGSWGLGTPLRIFRWLRGRRIDILHAYLFGFHFFTALPARILKVPVILSSRRELADWQRKRHRVIENLGNLFVDGVIACSHAVKQRTIEREKIGPLKIDVIHNGVDLSHFRSKGKAVEIRREFRIPEDAPLVGTVGNFAIEKGYPYFLKAAGRVAERFPEARFMVVGSGRYETEVRAEAAAIAIREKVIFTGSRSDIPDLLDAMDLFALASVSEGFPNVLLEAMAMAKPVVATAVGGIPELIDSGKDGLLVPARDSSALAEAIVELLRDRRRAQEMGQRAFQKIQSRFSLERMIDDYSRYYWEWLGTKKVVPRDVPEPVPS